MVVFASMMETITSAEHRFSPRFWSSLNSALNTYLRGLLTGSVQGPDQDERYFWQRLESIEQFALDNSDKLDGSKISQSVQEVKEALMP